LSVSVLITVLLFSINSIIIPPGLFGGELEQFGNSKQYTNEQVSCKLLHLNLIQNVLFAGAKSVKLPVITLGPVGTFGMTVPPPHWR